MKNIILLFLFTFLLSGCLFQSARWDNNEYQTFIYMGAEAVSAIEYCPRIEYILPYLKTGSVRLELYTRYLSNNGSTHAGAIEIKSMVDELDYRYKKGNVSKKYCEIKLNGIVESTDIVLKAIVKKVRD